MAIAVYDTLEKVRRERPVVHHLTNWVTIYDCAQIVKTLGASPVMAHAPEEVAEMAQIASALVLNIGTLTTELVAAMKLAVRSGNEKGIPVILDVCGAGATRMRDQACFELLDCGRIDIIKGNASEIARISGAPARTRGVDALEVAGDLLALARELAQARDATVVVTGKVDIVTRSGKVVLVKNGHPLMTSVVGTGCMAASVIGAFAAVEPDLLLAGASALSCYEIAAELAAEGASGPAAFKANLGDCLYHLDRQTCERQQQVEYLVHS